MNEEEKLSARRTLEYHRLSQEACEHVMMNEQFPLKTTTWFIFLEQGQWQLLDQTAKNEDSGNYKRGRVEFVERVKDNAERGWHNEGATHWITNV